METWQIIRSHSSGIDPTFALWTAPSSRWSVFSSYSLCRTVPMLDWIQLCDQGQAKTNVECLFLMITPKDRRAIQLSDIVVLLCAQGHAGGPTYSAGRKKSKKKEERFRPSASAMGRRERERHIVLFVASMSSNARMNSLPFLLCQVERKGGK